LFRRYWLVIRPASDAIRRSWLAAIRRHALRRSLRLPRARRPLAVVKLFLRLWRGNEEIRPGHVARKNPT
jgi:hypothetical protein